MGIANNLAGEKVTAGQEGRTLRITVLGLMSTGPGMESGCQFVLLLSHLAAVLRGKLFEPPWSPSLQILNGLLHCLNVIVLSCDDYMKKIHAKYFAQC